MKVKLEYIFLAVIIVGLVVYLALRPRDKVYEVPRLAVIEIGAIDKLSLIRAGGTIEVTKGSESWLVQPWEYPADPETIENILGSIADIAITVGVTLLVIDMLFNKDSPLISEADKERARERAAAKAGGKGQAA